VGLRCGSGGNDWSDRLGGRWGGGLLPFAPLSSVSHHSSPVCPPPLTSGSGGFADYRPYGSRTSRRLAEVRGQLVPEPWMVTGWLASRSGRPGPVSCLVRQRRGPSWGALACNPPNPLVLMYPGRTNDDGGTQTTPGHSSAWLRASALGASSVWSLVVGRASPPRPRLLLPSSSLPTTLHLLPQLHLRPSNTQSVGSAAHILAHLYCSFTNRARRHCHSRP